MNIMIALSTIYIMLVSVSSGGVDKITSLNDILTGAGKAVGAIICVVGVVKLVMSLADQNAVGKQQASLLIGVGSVFASISLIVKELDIAGAAGSTNGANAIGASVINILGAMVSWAGAVLAVVGVFMLIMSLVQEQPEQKAEATKFLGVSIGLISISNMTRMFAINMTAVTAERARLIVVTYITKISTWVGGFMVLMAVWHFVMSIREEDSREKTIAIRFAMAGIALIAMKAVLSSMGLDSSLIY